MKTPTRGLLPMLCALLLLAPGSARASLVVWDMVGQVTRIDAGSYWSDRGFAIGDPWTARVQYDANAPDLCAHPFYSGSAQLLPQPAGRFDINGTVLEANWGAIELGAGCMDLPPLIRLFSPNLNFGEWYAEIHFSGDPLAMTQASLRVTPPLAGGWEYIHGSAAVVTTIVPEPSMVLLLAVGVIGTRRWLAR